MIGHIGTEAFCDLYCWGCQCRKMTTCPMFGHKHTYTSAVVFTMGFRLPVFKDDEVLGFWKGKKIVGPNEYGPTKFPLYEGEVEN